MKISELQHNSEQSRQKTKESQKQAEKTTFSKENMDELTDLRKRVEQYRKSIEQLNSAHNTTREKLAHAN